MDGKNGTAGAEGPTDSRPPVVVISIDTLRSDFLPTYGYDGVETPHLDHFAEDAVVFERAYSHYPLTLPSHASLFTGRLPAAAGVRDNSRYRLEDTVAPFLPATLSAAGYATAGAVSTFVLQADTGMGRGFDVYHDVALEARADEGDDESRLPVGERSGEDTLALLLPWLESRPTGEPFFLFFHLYEPHLPHTPPEPFRARWGDTYEGEIAAADHLVGTLLDALRDRGLYDESLIFVLSDHGEEFGEHGEEGHGLLLYRQSLQVPLLMKLPHQESAGTRHPRPVQLADVLPTVLDVAGLAESPSSPESQGLAGASLRRLITQSDAHSDTHSDAQSEPRSIYSETLYPRIHYGWHELTSVIRGDHHLVAGLRAELFRLSDDPAETRDVLADERRVYRELEDERLRLTTPYEAPGGEVDEETRRQLASLGYLSSGNVRADEPTRDPRDVVPEVAPRLLRADEALKSDRFDEAESLYEELLEIDDAMPAAWKNLGITRMSLRDFDGAFEALEESLRLAADSQAARMAGRCLIQLSRLDEAEEHLRLAWTEEGGEGFSADTPEAGVSGGGEETRDALVILGLARQQPDEALRWARGGGGLAQLPPDTLLRLAQATSESHPHRADALEVLGVLTRTAPSAEAWNELARLQLASGDPAAASQALDRAMALEPRNAGSLEWLGLLALEQGRTEEARRLLTESVEKNDDSDNAWNLLAVARFQLGDAAGAMAAWQRAVQKNPGHLDALYNLGLTAARMGRRDLAMRSFRRYAEQATDEPARAAELAEVQKMLRGLGG